MNLEQAPASASKHAGERDRAGLKPFDLSPVGKLLESGCHRVSNNSGLEHDPEAGSEPDASFDLLEAARAVLLDEAIRDFPVENAVFCNTKQRLSYSTFIAHIC